MLLLPVITVEGSSWRLPFPNAAASRLANALLAANVTDRVEQFSRLLDDEPTLLLWSVARSGQTQNSVGKLSQWLAAQALMELSWESPQQAIPADPPTAKSLERWGESAATSVAAKWALPATASDEQVFATFLTASRCFFSPQNPPAHTSKRHFDAASFRHLCEIRKRWVESAEPTEFCLPTLVERLRRLQRLEAEFAATLETEKLASLKELAYGASHEINNPLANIATRAQTLLRDETHPERRRKLAVINAQAFRAHEMISDLMLFAKPPALRVERCSAVELIDTVIAELTADAIYDSIKLTQLASRTANADCVEADRVQMGVVIKAIAKNALEACQSGGEVTLLVRDAEPLAGSAAAVEIVIVDNGPGISPAVRRHLFDPFYSGREAGRGLGFGLSKSWRIVTLHGGAIRVEDTPGGGATFIIRLPVRQASAAVSVA